MKKVKFNITGMNCNSCATLIEDKVKSLKGIASVKVSFDSRKAVVMYDENQASEAEIEQAIKKTGNYELEKIEDAKSENRPAEAGDSQERHVAHPDIVSSKTSFAIGLLTMFSIISVAFNVAFATKYIKAPDFGQAENEDGQNQFAQPQLPPPSPSAEQIPAKPAIQTFEITKDNHVRGNLNAPITMVEFSDFECPFCARFYPTVKKILADYPDKVRFVYKHFPLDFHPNSQKAAEASECADEQGKFWEYHDVLFEKQPLGFSTDNFKQWAKDLKLNSKKFNDCLDSEKYSQKVQADASEGAAKGVNGTPASFINGEFVSGAQPYNTFKTIIDNTLNQQL